MNRLNQILVITLGVQVLIAGAIYYGSQAPDVSQQQVTLISPHDAQIDTLKIEDNKGTQVSLSRQQGKWQLPDYHQLPADQGRIDQLLNRLQKTRLGWPVATTGSSRKRFEVTDKKYRKKLTLSLASGENKVFYLGTSPGFRQIHIRKEGDDSVYAVKLNDYDFPAENRNWLDATLLSMKAGIDGIKGSDFSLQKEGDNWKFEKDTRQVDNNEVSKLTNSLKRLRILDVAEKSPDKHSYDLLVDANKRHLTYHFYKDDKNYYVKREDVPQNFKISKSDYETITGRTITQLAKTTGKKKGKALTKNKQRTRHVMNKQPKKEVMSDDKS